MSISAEISFRGLSAMHAAVNNRHEWLGFSLKSIFLILLGIIVLGLYVGVLLFGENSLTVLNRLEHEKEAFIQERKEIKTSNQKLQKAYFELLQLTE